MLSEKAISQIIKDAERIVGFESDIEITLEANPGTFEQEKFSGFRAAGVNRLSIGIQSFNDTQLKLLGRVHGRDEALRAIDVARNAGFDNINLDLMHGLPQQSVEDAKADLVQAISLAPEHISCINSLSKKILNFIQHRQFYPLKIHLPIFKMRAKRCLPKLAMSSMKYLLMRKIKNARDIISITGSSAIT